MAASDSETTPSSPRWRELLWENGKTIGTALIIVAIIRLFIAEPRYIPSGSMLPTLEEGDRVVVEKVSYYWHPPQPGDVIVFNPPAQLQDWGYLPHQAFIKRVIGTPGHAIAVHDRHVYEDDHAIQEPYILEEPNYEMPSLPIPRESLFVMGDNRNNSNDSHIWGYLPQQNVIGRAMFRFWPLNRMGWV
ncbi:MAG: signal peptidase I [Cyanobacteria bacterium P01_G01_bin.54]